jgi:hypothetical protein
VKRSRQRQGAGADDQVEDVHEAREPAEADEIILKCLAKNGDKKL